jgi:sulfofructose kinase
MAPEVLCIGHAAYDVGVFVEHFPEENSKCETRELIESGGGPAANAAWLLSHWGVGCAFAGVVGDDLYGQRIRDDFVKVGADVSLLELRAGHATPLSLILINKQNGSRTIVNRKLPGTPLRIDTAGLSPKVLLFDGHEPEASLATLRDFPDAVSILDAGSWREGTAALAGKVSFLAASERFAKQATGMKELGNDESRRACVAKLRKKHPTTVVVTLGEHGMIADDGSGFRHLPAFPAEAVDTTAAGDIFHGAFAYGVLQKWTLGETLRFAAMTASLSVRVPGGRDSIPTLNQVKEALAHGG